MFTLTFVEPSGRREEVPLAEEERGLVVGREAECDFIVESREVSRRHARFFVRGGRLLVEDLGSHNGVFWGETRAEGPTEVPLGVEVELGDVRVIAAGAPSAKAELPAKPPPARRPAPSSTPAEPPVQGSARAGAAAARARAIAAAEAKGPQMPGKRPAPRSQPAPTLSLEDPEERGIIGVGAGAALRGVGKAAAQLVLPARAVIGRAAECDVVLDDDSVSRRHAELYRDERGLYRLRDLGSANGTFVDGRQARKDELLSEGARLRFGDVELLLWRPAAAPAERSRRRQVLLGALVLLLSALGAVFWAQERRREERAGQAAAEAATPEDEAAALTAQAQAALESDRFDEAARLSQQASEKDPLAQAPRRLVVQARREQDAAKAYEAAVAKAAVGGEDEALRLFAGIDPQSRFFAKARIKAKDLAQGLVRSHGRACLARLSHDAWDEAAAACAAALDIKCQLASSLEQDPLYKALRRAEKALARKVPWSCPPQLAPLFHDSLPGDEQAAAEAQKALRARYPDEKVLAAVQAYAKGELQQAMRNLGSPQVAKGPSAALAAEAAERVRLVDGRFREGQTALLRGELTKVDELWGQALAADAALLPAGVGSYYEGQMRSALCAAHSKAGDERAAKGQYTGAYDDYLRGLAVSPKDPHLLDQLARLEKVAEELVAAGGCDQLLTASRITRAEPPSAAHAAAEKGLARCQ
jgi:ABC transport system ATP-binding/permease protein